MKSLLSIQSHVSHGYVGGKAAIFPLQCQGWEVDYLNTVEFSNHTGYGSFAGDSLEINQAEKMLNRLLDLGVTYQYILTGYIPNEKLIFTIHQFIKKYKLKNQDTLYLLDPVLGDNDYLYVEKSCITTYKSILKDQLVDIITPNQFEFELLVDAKIVDNKSLVNGLDFLINNHKVRFVVITSIELPDGTLGCIIGTKQGAAMFKIHKIDSYFTGVGDLFSSLLADRLSLNLGLKGLNDLEILSRSVNQVLTIITKTLRVTRSMALLEYQEEFPEKDGLDLSGTINDSNMKFFELKVVQCREHFGYKGDGEFIEHDLDIGQ